MKTFNSCIYRGQIRHRRFTPKKHDFSYKLFFLAIDLDELDQVAKMSPWFKKDKFAAMSFRSSDYLDNKPSLRKQDVWQKVRSLGGKTEPGRVLFVGQLRCLGIYFSPINLYYCFDQAEQLCYLLAEVSNTPWNERHYYLLTMTEKLICEKAFHVSPFMEMEMHYQWRIKVPGKRLNLHIENHSKENNEKVFDATLTMSRMELNNRNLRRCFLSIPSMTLKTLAGIYWQALKIFIKGVPYVPYKKDKGA
jgi:DUF1365 family protein